MATPNVLGIIYSNVYDDCLSELTSVRTMGSVPFAGRYRLIDFVLSGMVNGGIAKVGISTKANYQSLMDHIGSGKAWDLSRKRDGMTILPPFNLTGSGGVYKSRLEALSGMLQYISESGKDYVLLSDCNVVCNLDYEKIIDEHIKGGADITIAYKRGVAPKFSDNMSFELDGDKITRLSLAKWVTQLSTIHSTLLYSAEFFLKDLFTVLWVRATKALKEMLSARMLILSTSRAIKLKAMQELSTHSRATMISAWVFLQANSKTSL